MSEATKVRSWKIKKKIFQIQKDGWLLYQTFEFVNILESESKTISEEMLHRSWEFHIIHQVDDGS